MQTRHEMSPVEVISKNYLDTLPLDLIPLLAFYNQNSYIALGQTCKNYARLLFTVTYYLSKLKAINLQINPAEISEHNYGLDDFLESLERGTTNVGGLGISLLKILAEPPPYPRQRSGMEIAAALGGFVFVGVPGFVVTHLTGAAGGAGHGLFRVCTRKYRTTQELQDLNLYIHFFEKQHDSLKNSIINDILSGYDKQGYHIATSNSSQSLIKILNEKSDTNTKWDGIVSYMTRIGEGNNDKYLNNGKALFNIIYNELHLRFPGNLCPKSVENHQRLNTTLMLTNNAS